MQSFLAKCAALGIVAGGFTLTGDVGRLAERGRRLLDASTVPSETPAEEQTAESRATTAPVPAAASPGPAVTSPSRGHSAAAATPAAAAAASTAPAAAGIPLLDAPIGRAVAVPAPPANGPDSIDLRHVPAGNRLLVWVRRAGSTDRTRSMDLIALDLIDPNTGEALEHRHAAMSHGSTPTAVHAAPRRVVITRDSTRGVAKGTILRVTPVHGVAGVGREEAIGTVQAIEVQGR